MIDKRFVFTDNDRRFIIEYAIFINEKCDEIVKQEYLCSKDAWEDQKKEIFDYLEWKERKLNQYSDEGFIYQIRIYAIYQRMGV